MNTDKIYAEAIVNEYSKKSASKAIALRKLDRAAKRWTGKEMNKKSQIRRAMKKLRKDSRLRAEVLLYFSLAVNLF